MQRNNPQNNSQCKNAIYRAYIDSCNKPRSYESDKSNRYRCVAIQFIIAAFLFMIAASTEAYAQSFDSGSNGTDGAFIFNENASGTYCFKPDSGDENDPEPSIEILLGRALNWDDTRFDFTSISIPAGITIRFSAKWTNEPIYWLSTQAVEIEGALDLSGENGAVGTLSSALRRPAIPGPGGFPGGVGGNRHPQTRGVAQAGLGPGGGRGANTPGATYNNYTSCGEGAQPSGNTFLVPLIGGSGGGGGTEPVWGDANSMVRYYWWGGGGGAGGGAILISSSILINVTGSINANGGAGNTTNEDTRYGGAGGGGGSIRLIAPIIQGDGIISVQGGGRPSYCGSGTGAMGRIRLEAFQQNWNFSSISSNWTTGSPLSSYVPTTPKTIMVTRIADVPVPPNPSGSFELPDATIDTSESVTVEIEAHGIPVGTTPRLYLFSLEASDNTVDCEALVGSFQSSTSTASVVFPPGFTRGYVRAVW